MTDTLLWFAIIGAAFAAGWALVTPETYGLARLPKDYRA
jgi:hypothetical protein